MAPSFQNQRPVSLVVILLAFLAAGVLSVFLSNSGSVMSVVNGVDEGKEASAAAKSAELSLPVVKLAPAVIPQEAIHLKARGIVEAARSSELASNVSGLVEWVDPQFQPGAEIAGGSPILRIAKQGYVAELADAKANLEEARLAQAEEQKEALKALRKWDSNPRAKGEQSELVMRLPHRRAMTARVAAAEERVKQAERMVENTTIAAPYDCRVSSKQVDLGMRVGEGDPLGCVFSSKEREIRILLSAEKLKALPRNEKGEVCSFGSVSLTTAGTTMTWNAEIVRISSQADPRTQEIAVMALVNENPDYLPEFRVPPLNLELKFDFQAQTTDGLFWIPVSGMAGDSEIWVMTESGELAKRPVNIEQSEGDRRLVMLYGRSPGDRICLEVPADARPGMKVREGSEKKENSKG